MNSNFITPDDKSVILLLTFVNLLSLPDYLQMLSLSHGHVTSTLAKLSEQAYYRHV